VEGPWRASLFDGEVEARLGSHAACADNPVFRWRVSWGARDMCLLAVFNSCRSAGTELELSYASATSHTRVFRRACVTDSLGSAGASPPPLLPNPLRPLRAVRAARRWVTGGDGPQDPLPLARRARQHQEGRRSGQRADRHAGALGCRRGRRRAGRRGRPAPHRALPAPSAKGINREINGPASPAVGGRPPSPSDGSAPT
jgi:hypothetical protein